MILRDVGLATYRLSHGKRDDECAEYRKFEFQTSCIDDLYRRCLPKLVTPETAKVLIDVSDEADWVNPSQIQRLLSVTISPWKASLEDYWSRDEFGRKQFALEALHGGLMWLAIDATSHPSPEVRAEACSVIQNQCGWKVDVSEAVAPLLRLLEDDSDRVRMQAACAVGNLAERKYDMSPHVVPLDHNLRQKDVSVRNYSAWALWHISRGKHDISDAVPELVQLLTDDEDWNDPLKNAVGALLHHSKKASGNLEQVRRCLKKVRIDPENQQIQRFLEQLARMN